MSELRQWHWGQWTDAFTDDAAEATRKVKGDYPGQDKEAKKAGEEAYEAVRARAQGLVSPSQPLSGLQTLRDRHVNEG